MEISTILEIVGGIAAFVIALSLLVASIFTVSQGTVAVITRFGKYKRTVLPGLSFKNPLFDKIYSVVSIQNRSSNLKFQAITIDQANVYFEAMLLYSVISSNEDIVQLVAFKFNSAQEFTTAISKTIEGSVRSFVATKKQSEILSLRKEIVDYVKEHLDEVLKSWGYHLLDLQVNDIIFDKVIMDSMSQVVSSSNLRAAAENEGAALLIKKTKAAEAEGNAIKIQAAAEKEAATLRGQGVAAFREEVAKGMTQAAKELSDSTGDIQAANNMIMFSMWTEAIKNFAEVGKGNVIFLDGSSDGMNKSINQMMAMNTLVKSPNGKPVAAN